MVDTFDRFQGARSTYGIKKPCRAAATSNVVLSGFQVVDGVTYASSDEAAGLNMRCAVMANTDGTENGIYLVNSGAWTREKDFDGNTDFTQGTLVFILSGTSNGGRLFYVSTSDPQSIGVTSVTFSAVYGKNMISVNTTGAATTGSTAETNLITYSVPAGILSADGYGLRVSAWGTVAATTAVKQVRAYFGGTSIADTGSVALNNHQWSIAADIIRTGAAAQKTHGTIHASSGTILPAVCQLSTPGETLTGAVTLRVTGATVSTATAAITASGMTVELLLL